MKRGVEERLEIIAVPNLRGGASAYAGVKYPTLMSIMGVRQDAGKPNGMTKV
jgi:hypothetical protein